MSLARYGYIVILGGLVVACAKQQAVSPEPQAANTSAVSQTVAQRLMDKMQQPPGEPQVRALSPDFVWVDIGCPDNTEQTPFEQHEKGTVEIYCLAKQQVRHGAAMLFDLDANELAQKIYDQGIVRGCEVLQPDDPGADDDVVAAFLADCPSR